MLESLADWLDQAAPAVLTEGARQAAAAIVLHPPLPGASEFRLMLMLNDGKEKWIHGRVEGVRFAVDEGSEEA
jgi:hypothetical protein